jgi:riboflavin kinase / FMN adenylyltransferase
MRVFHSLEEAAREFGPSALSIGNFDGVHFGHRRILKRVKQIARQRGWKAAVLTFDPHPTRVVAPERTPALLMAPEARVALMEEEGIEEALILPFTRELAALEPAAFAARLLVEAMGARAVLVGDNFHFGKGQAGNVRVLEELGRQFGFETEIVPAVRWRGRTVSSSGIRELIRTGSVALAARMLQHAYGIEGDVVSGRGVGSRETVPTLNLATHAEVIPANGVYITRTRDLDGSRTWDSVTNVGVRPTYADGGARTIETFLLGEFAGETPRRIRVAFLRRIREERVFTGSTELKLQILRDVKAAQAFFRRTRRWAEASCTFC